MNFNAVRAAMTDEEQLLVRRAEQMRDAAAGGNVSFSCFLTPREAFILKSFGLMTNVARDALCEEEAICFLWGGYPDAERAVFCAIPSYLAYSLPPADIDGDSFDESLSQGISASEDELVSELVSLIADELKNELVPLFIKASGYVKLTHRDYLGALVGLGIDRNVLGDIIVKEDGAIVFAKTKVADFLCTELCEVGRDKVRALPLSGGESIIPRREFETVTGTVASARLDAVVGELTHASRETAKELIRRGLVEHNYFPATDTDTAVNSGDIISVKREGKIRFGKYAVDSIGELTAKGRCRFSARRYM